MLTRKKEGRQGGIKEGWKERRKSGFNDPRKKEKAEQNVSIPKVLVKVFYI